MKMLNIVALASLFCITAAGPRDTIAIHASPDTLRALRTSDTPVLLPTIVPRLMAGTMLAAHIGTSAGTSPHGYEVVVGFTPDCDGTVCEAAYLTGDHGDIRDLPRSAKKVRLRDGGVAYFVSHPCYASCEDSAVLRFERGGYNYRISVKAGHLADTILIANGLVPLRR